MVAANVDVVFLVTSLNEDLNLRRLERYLTLAWESGARPVIVLTKADLYPDPEAAVAEVESIAGGVPVHAISSRPAPASTTCAPSSGRATAALLGSSGVGKSTLINTLAGEELLATQEIRDDGRGRHTTTRRELILLPTGALVIDTPGMRELQLWVADDGIDEAFEDVTDLFARCRFSDCAHDRSPAAPCGPRSTDGSLAAERWDSYRKLQAELAHLERKLDERAASEARKRWKAMSQDASDADEGEALEAERRER